MGFIQDRPGFDSFNKVAERLLASSEWPDRDVSVRGLGNALRELDEGGRRPWLAKSAPRGAAIARELRMSDAEFADALADHPEPPRGTVLVLTDLPDGAPLDLLREDLFPGIPKEVLDPARWGPLLWWEAPGGAGKSLTGRWLQARSLARHVRAKVAEDLIANLGGDRPLFVELESPAGLDRLLDLTAPEGQPLCVAAAFAPPNPPEDPGQKRKRASQLRMGVPPAETSSRWRHIATRPLPDWSDRLLEWVSHRLPSTTGFSLEPAKAVIAAWKTRLRTPGDVLAVCGLLDQWGAEKVARGHPRAWEHAVEMAFARVPDAAPPGEWLRGHAVALLRATVQRLATSPEVEWELSDLVEVGLSRTEWTELLPPEFVPDPDIASLREEALTAAGRGEALRPDRVMVRLQPGRGEVVRLLVEAHLLEARGDGRLVFRIRWLLLWAWELVLADSSDWGADRLGEAVLRRWAAPSLIEAFMSAFLRGDWGIASRAVDGWSGSDIARVALLEACFRAAGLALLQGAEIPEGLARALWERQCASLSARYEGAGPVPTVAWPGGHDPLLDDAAWHLAALALIERFPDHERERALETLSAAPGAPPREQLMTLLQNVGLPESVTSEGMRPLPWARGSLGLGSRLFARYGPIPRYPDHPHVTPIVAPAALIGAIRQGTALDAAAGSGGFNLHRVPLDILRHEAAEQEVPWTTVLAALWAADPQSSLGAYISHMLDGPDRDELWAACPPGRLAQEWMSGRSERVRLELLNEEQWAALLDLMGGQRRWPVEREFWELVPWSVIEPLLADPQAPLTWATGAYSVFWTRHPVETREAMLASLAAGSRVGGDLLWSAPVGEAFALCEHPKPQLRLAAGRRLHGIVASRGERWREAWDALVRLRRSG